MDNLEILLTEELQQEFLEYLKEDPEFSGLESLNEEVLTEGKLLNKIRWKLALFSLRFLKENSINDFLRAYYSDKDGKETEKSREWVAKKKKEKLRKIREIANEKMSQDAKDKVANSQQAKQLESRGLTSLVYAGIAGASAGIAYSQSQAAKNASNDAINKSKNTGETFVGTSSGKIEGKYLGTIDGKTAAELTGNISKNELTGNIANGNMNYGGTLDSSSWTLDAINGKSVQVISLDKVENGNVLEKFNLKSLEKHYPDFNRSDYNLVLKSTSVNGGGAGSTWEVMIEPKNTHSVSGNINGSVSGSSSGSISGISTSDTSGSISGKGASSILSLASTLLTSLASLFFGVMWGSIIIAGVQTVKGVRSMHKANVVRRDEIMSELLKNKDTRDLKECLQFLDGDLKSQKTLIEMYQSGDYDFYNAVNNIYQQKFLKEDFSKYNKE